MNMTLIAFLLLGTATVAFAVDESIDKDAGEFTVQWLQHVPQLEQPQHVMSVGETRITLRPLPKEKAKDAPRAAIFVGESRATKTPIYPGKRYHFALVYRGGNAQWFVNGYPDGPPVTDLLVGEIVAPVGADSATTTLDEALSDNKILAGFMSELQPCEILTVAHRGVHKHAPENTRISYVQAIAAGAPVVEFDTALTSDGHIVGMHDKTVDRTTDGTGKLAEMTLEQVRKLEAGSWKDPKYKGEPVPTLDEIADVVRGKAILMLDLKAEGQGAAIAKWIETSKFPHDQLIVAPWEDAEGVALRKHIPASVPMIRLTSKVPAEVVNDEYFAKMKSMGFSGFSVNWQYLTQEFVQGAHKNGMKVYVWTLNDPPDIAGAALLGVDGVITDDSAATIELLAELIPANAIGHH